MTVPSANTRSLADCGEWLSGGTPRKSNPSYWGGTIPWISAKSLKSTRIVDSEDRVTTEGAAQIKLVPPGTIIFVVRGMSLANEFRVGIAQRTVVFNQDLRALIPDDDVDPYYLARYLRWDQQRILALSDNAAHGTKRLPVDRLRSLQIPLPPLPEQKRIAGILDAADALRAKRREALAQLDTLLQSTFFDMFGDPVTNPLGWEVSTLDRVLMIEHGYAFKSDYFADAGEYIVLTPGSFNEGGGYRDQGKKTKYYSIEPPEKFVLPAGALLVAMTEQAPGLLGSPIFVPGDGTFLHNQRLGRVRVGDRLDAVFVYHLFNTAWVRSELQHSSTGTKVKHTSPKKIGAIKSIIPPLDLQRRFAAIVDSVEQQKARMRAHLAELDTLFASLQSRAFNGEL